MIFLGELNNLVLWGADIGNAYLEAYTNEKIFIIAGSEFEELEGFILIFNKALYGLKSSGKRWAERFYDIIKDMGFTPSKADPSIWMRENKKKCYEYIATYVDDLCIAAQDPGKIIQPLKEEYKLKVKGDCPLSHHLGADYTRDKELLTMIGQIEWLVTLGRFDIHVQVTNISRFRSAPTKGYLERLQRIYGYVLKTNHYSTRYRTEEPDYSYLPNIKHDWPYTVYGNV